MWSFLTNSPDERCEIALSAVKSVPDVATLILATLTEALRSSELGSRVRTYSQAERGVN
jgi:hypothetical protein